MMAQGWMAGREGLGCGGRTTIGDHRGSCGSFVVTGYAAGGNRDGGVTLSVHGHGSSIREIGGNGVGTAKIFLSGL